MIEIFMFISVKFIIFICGLKTFSTLMFKQGSKGYCWKLYIPLLERSVT